MGDFGLYAALSGTDNWAQKRQDKASNLMMLQSMEQRSEKQLASQMQAEQGIQEQLDLMSTFDVLPEDQKAIEEVENKARMNIIKGITKFNGDLKKYVSSGGLTDLGEYKRSILTSSQMKNAVTNKAQYAQYIDAKQKDMFVGKSQIEVPVFDSKGNPQMKDGEIVREMKNLTMDEQMALRKRGLLDKIQVGMIEKKARINPDYFKRNYKDATKPWSADNIVTEQNIRNTLKSQGYSDEQANKLANEYGDGLTADNALKWKAMNQLELENQQAATQYRLSKANGSGGTGSGKTKITNTIATTFDKLKKRPGLMMPTKGNLKVDGARGAQSTIDPKASKYFKEWFKEANPKAYDAHYGLFKENKSDGKYDLTGANVNFEEYVTKFNDDTQQVESFIKAGVFYPEELSPFDDIDEERKTNWKEVNRKYLKDKDGKREVVENPGYYGHVLIPVENVAYNTRMAASLAKYQNIGTNVNRAPAGNTLQGDIANNDERTNNMVFNVMSQINPTTNSLYTIEEAEEIVRVKLGQQ